MIKVFVSGCYDILHGGHIEFFLQAKALGDYLIVSIASDNVLYLHKKRKSSIPLQHKINLLKSLRMVDEVVIGDNTEIGLDFQDEFKRIKPDILVVTNDDKYEDKKSILCDRIDAKYVKLPKTLDYSKVSTTDIVNWIKAPIEVPLRIDFGGGWLDVPKFARSDSFVVNCTISPLVSINKWPYEISSGLGGSAAYSILSGNDAVDSELKAGVGWQDPAVINETGLCVWRSGPKPILEYKTNPDFLNGKMALLWTGKPHICKDLVDIPRNYDLVQKAGSIAKSGAINRSLIQIANSVNVSYEMQLDEGMHSLPDFGENAKKYCGGGYGGYAVYLWIFDPRPVFDKLMPIEPYIKYR